MVSTDSSQNQKNPTIPANQTQQGDDMSNLMPKGKQGFASMDRKKRSEIARLGGVAAHQKGTAHKFTSEEARAAGRKGGRN